MQHVLKSFHKVSENISEIKLRLVFLSRLALKAVFQPWTKWKSKLILNAKWKSCKSRKNLCTKNFKYTNKFYVHETVAVNLSKIYFLKNAKKRCKPNKRDLNRDWFRYKLGRNVKKKYRKYLMNILVLKMFKLKEHIAQRGTKITTIVENQEQ